MMNIGVHSDSIPVDLIVEILSRLPAKSIVRFRCVSKLWKSMPHRPYFTELFLTMSWTRPRLLFFMGRSGEWRFYSSPQPQRNLTILRWRKIQCPITHDPRGEGICINGILYYLAKGSDTSDFIICFDVRSETFKFLDATWFCQWSNRFINYKGKLGLINRFLYTYPIVLRMWVLEDVEKQEFLEYTYTLPPENKLVDPYNFSVHGVTSTGEIVLSSCMYKVPFYVFYFNPERNTLCTVEIQGVGEYHEEENDRRVHVFVDHVEDLKFNVKKIKYASKKKSRRPTRKHRKQNYPKKQERPTFESINKFDALCLCGDDDE